MNLTPEPRDDAPGDYLRSLVEAMRRVVEVSRDRTLAEMREAVESEAGQLDEARAAREAGMRERAEADIAAVGTWERAEVERIRAEAMRKVQARGRQLDQELAQLAASTNAEHAALAARADAYEREVAAFMEGLDGIDDPSAFAAAARRMPTPPSQRVQPPLPAGLERATPEPAAAAPAASQPMGPAAETPQPVAAPELEPSAAPLTAPVQPYAAEAAEAEPPAAMPEPAAAEPTSTSSVPEPAAPVAESAVAMADSVGVTVGDRNGETATDDASADEATSIQVRGLSSFGAITSFKQSLEKVEGVHSVTLGLGPSGEFVYTARHAATIDLDAAIRGIETGAEIERDNDTLRVRVGRKAG
jgi:hypothetical protein